MLVRDQFDIHLDNNELIGLINPNDVARYLKNIARKHETDEKKIPQLEKVLCAVLTEPLSYGDHGGSWMRHRVFDKAASDFPERLKEKYPNGAAYTQFVPTIELDKEIQPIVHWIQQAILNRDEWAKNIISANKSFMQAKDLVNEHDPQPSCTLEDVHEIMRDDIAEINQRHEKLKLAVGEDYRTHCKFKDGYSFVQLLTPNALRKEGADMQHCLGTGLYDEMLSKGENYYYSLRDEKNRPHITLEVRSIDGGIMQCFGKQNEPPAEKYMKYVNTLVKRDNLYRADAPIVDMSLEQFEARKQQKLEDKFVKSIIAGSHKGRER